MDFEEPGPNHEPPEFHELSGLKRGHYVRLKMDDTFLWVQVRGVHFGRITGIVESSFPGGPERGDEIIFHRRNIFEIN